MSAQDDSVQGYALGAVAGIVGLVLAGVIALAIATGQRGGSGDPSAQRVYFDASGEALTTEGDELLARIAESARANEQLMVVIAGVRDAKGDTAAAQRRALRVRHSLEANGVPPERLALSQPLPAARSAKESRRVDVSLR
ncbi:MAG: OmpA family protein [Rhizobacter sp.]|nr:OmpA family protein [Rhizobacter sp.]